MDMPISGYYWILCSMFHSIGILSDNLFSDGRGIDNSKLLFNTIRECL